MNIFVMFIVLVVMFSIGYFVGSERGKTEERRRSNKRFIRSMVANSDEYLDSNNWSSGRVHEGDFRSPTLS